MSTRIKDMLTFKGQFVLCGFVPTSRVERASAQYTGSVFYMCRLLHVKDSDTFSVRLGNGHVYSGTRFTLDPHEVPPNWHDTVDGTACRVMAAKHPDQCQFIVRNGVYIACDKTGAAPAAASVGKDTALKVAACAAVKRSADILESATGRVDQSTDAAKEDDEAARKKAKYIANEQKKLA